MNVVSGINKFLESKATAATIFTVTGISKLASDYNVAPEDKQDYILAHDSAVLAASALGVIGYNILTKKAMNSKFTQKAISTAKNSIKNYMASKNYGETAKTALKYACNITTKCADNTAMLGTGILGAIGADYFMHSMRLDKLMTPRKYDKKDEAFYKIYTAKNDIINKFQDSGLNRTLENTMGMEVKDNMYNRFFDFPAMKMFTASMVGMQGFEVIEEKTLKKRMKHATKSLIANSVVPIFFLQTASAFTQKMKPILRLPITFTTMIYGTMYTNKFIENHQYSLSRKERKQRYY